MPETQNAQETTEQENSSEDTQTKQESSSNGTQDVNEKLSVILSQVMPNMALTADDFSRISHGILDCVQVKDVDELNSDSIDKLKLFHQKMLMLLKAKQKPNYTQSIAYARVVDVLSAGVLSRYLIRPFKVYFEKLTFINLLDEILGVDFQTTSGMLANASLMLDELESLLIEEILLQLTRTELYKFKQVVAKLSQFFALSETSKNQARKLFRLLQEKIKPVVGYDAFVLEQKIIAELNPLDANLAPTALSLVSNPSQNDTEYSKLKGLMLSNYHITKLEFELCRYGFSGEIQFQISYDDKFHSDYLFLYQNQPISIALTIENTYVFDDPEKKNTKYVKELTLQGVAELSYDDHLRFTDPLVAQDIDAQTCEFAAKLPFFTFKFADALQSFWRLHKPLYVDFNKSYLDVFEQNNFFANWAEIDSAKSKRLAVKQKQITVATHDRSFYDYFIEALDRYGVYLVYDYEKLTNGKALYHLYDEISDFQVKDTEKGTLTSRDLLQVEAVDVQVRPPWNKTERILNLAQDNSVCTQVTGIYPEEYLALSAVQSVKHTLMRDVKIATNTTNWLLSQKKRAASCEYYYQVELKEMMPFVPVEPSYNPMNLDRDQWQCSLANFSKSILVSKQGFRLVQNKSTIVELQKKLLSQNYEPDATADKDRFEKITMVGESSGITHFIDIMAIWQDGLSEENDLPEYVPFQSFVCEAAVTIGENVDDSVKYGYKFYKGQTVTEGSFADDPASKLEDYVYSGQSENALTYAVNLPTILYQDPQNKTPVFVPVPLRTSASNSFTPLRNGDYVEVRFLNAEVMEIAARQSKSAVVEDKASQKMVQQSLYGPQQECQLAYTQDSNDQVLQLMQNGKDGQGVNALSLSQQEGIVLMFSDEKESE